MSLQSKSVFIKYVHKVDEMAATSSTVKVFFHFSKFVIHLPPFLAWPLPPPVHSLSFATLHHQPLFRVWNDVLEIALTSDDELALVIRFRVNEHEFDIS